MKPRRFGGHPRVQRGGRAARPVRAALSRARCARADLRGDLHQRRQPRPLGGAAARAVRGSARTRRASSCSTATSASTSPSWRASRRAAASAWSPLDADLQNPPEEIGKLLAKMDEGHDYVGTVRSERQDTAFRRHASRLMNALRERITRIHMTDQGCMLRAYSRAIVDTVNACREINTFIPALAYTFAQRPTEIEVAHEERAAGESKYSLYSLVRLNFDLVTGFSVLPLQLFSLSGIVISLLSIAFVLLLAVRRLIVGPEAEGVFTLFGIAFFLIGITLFGIGLLGEYIGRIYEQVRERPRYVIQAILEKKE